MLNIVFHTGRNLNIMMILILIIITMIMIIIIIIITTTITIIILMLIIIEQDDVDDDGDTTTTIITTTTSTDINITFSKVFRNKSFYFDSNYGLASLSKQYIPDLVMIQFLDSCGPLTGYAKLRVAHAPGMPGTFSRQTGLAIPTCIASRASRTCRDACRDR